MSFHLVQRGLVIKSGERQLAFHRMLEDKKVQFEDVRSGTYKVFSLVELQNGVASGKFVVVGAQQVEEGWVSQVESDTGTAAVVARLDEKHQQEWQRRLAYVKGMRRQGVVQASRALIRAHIPRIAQKIGDKNPPCDSTVISWMALFVKSGGSHTSLVPRTAFRRSAKRTEQTAIDDAWVMLKKYYFRREGFSLAEVWRRIQAKRIAEEAKGLRPKTISKSTLWRIAQTVPAYDRDRVRIGSAAANAKWRHATGGVYATRPLERVEMDHTELDIYVIDERRGIPLGRPVITVLIDAFSGYILSIYLSFEGETLSRMSRSIKLALQPKDSLTKSVPTENEWLTLGLWESLVVDNGLAFHSPQLQSMALALGCELEYCPVRKPWFKPSVERAMLEFGRILPLEGKTSKLRGVVDPYNPLANACITFGDLVECLTRWVVDVYPFTIPDRSLERPIDRLKSGLENAPAPVVHTGLDSLEIITGLSKEVAVRQGGVEHMYLPYRSPELGELVRRQRSPTFKTTMKYDPNDLGRIWVQDPSERTWTAVPCLYEDYAKGLSLGQHRLIRKNVKEELRRSGAYEQLMRAQAQLRDMFEDRILRGKGKIRSNKQYAKFSGMSSLSLTDQSVPLAPIFSTPIVVDAELKVQPREIPVFQAVNLRSADGWEYR